MRSSVMAPQSAFTLQDARNRVVDVEAVVDVVVEVDVEDVDVEVVEVEDETVVVVVEAGGASDMQPLAANMMTTAAFAQKESMNVTEAFRRG